MPEEPTLERYLRTWPDAIALSRHPGLFLPFILLATVKILLLLLAGLFWLPGLVDVVAPVLGSLAGEGALHFPSHVKMLPDIYGVTDIFVMMTIGFPIYAWAVFMIMDALDERFFQPFRYLPDVAFLMTSILIIGFVFVAGSLVAPFLLDQLGALFYRHPKLQLLILMSSVFLNFAFHVLFVYSFVFLKTYEGNALHTMGRSIRFAREHLPLTSAIIVTVLLIRWPFAHLASDTGTLLATGKGYWVLIYLALGILVDIFASFYLFASTTVIGMSDRRRRTKRNA